MIIRTIEEAEEFVRNSPKFDWDGWDIVYVVQDDYAEFLSVGFLNKADNKWYKRVVYACGENGWEIPDSVIR